MPPALGPKSEVGLPRNSQLSWVLLCFPDLLGDRWKEIRPGSDQNQRPAGTSLKSMRVDKLHFPHFPELTCPASRQGSAVQPT